MNYQTELKTWGDTGQVYPDNYSYQDKEQPVDHWDNFFAYNVIQDINHLIDVTNNDLVMREGGQLDSNLTVGTNSLVGEAGEVIFSGTELTLGADVDVTSNLSVQNNISVSGTVDGVDISSFESDVTSGFTNLNNSIGDINSDINSLESSLSNHESEPSVHHTRYSDQEASDAAPVQTVNGNTGAVVVNEFSDNKARSAIDGHTIDVLSAGTWIENATVATKDDLPDTAPDGAEILVKENGEKYIYESE